MEQATRTLLSLFEAELSRSKTGAVQPRAPLVNRRPAEPTRLLLLPEPRGARPKK